MGGPWSAKAEYLYVGLPAKNAHDLVLPQTWNTYNVKSDAHIVRLGLNYHLNGGLPIASTAFASAAVPSLGSWTGFYIGAVAGGALQNTIIDDKNCNLSCSSQNLNGSGFTAGVTGGWNYQFGPGLVGIEGDFNWANFKGSFTDPQWSTPNGTVHSAQWKSFSTIRGRVGLVADRALIYATGGVAFVDIDDYAHSLTAGCNIRGCFSVTGVQTGLAAGVGAEYALWDRWSAKAEYLYVGLPTKNTHDLVRAQTWNTYNVKSDAHIVRLGLNYHLNGGLPTTSTAFASASVPNLGSWTGFYIGAVAGGALQNTIMDDKDCNLSCSSLNFNGSGFTAGITGGWNYQFGSGLVGIEGDFNWANFKGSFTDPQWSNPNGTIHSAEWKSVSTIRGRAGLVMDRALIYATGGVAFVDVDDYGHSLTTGCNTRGCFSVTGVQTGLAAGVGAEYALWDRWSAKAEYLYVGLPAKNARDLVLPQTYNTYNVKSDAHIVRVGLNYHFK